VSESTKNGLATGLHPHPQGSLKRSPNPSAGFIGEGKKRKEEGTRKDKERGKERGGEKKGGRKCRGKT